MIELGIKTPPADTASAVTSKYTEAYNLNVRICINAQMAQQNLYEVCKGLKEMRDGKLYKELGYQNFEEYCESEVGFTRQNAYKYIKVAEHLPQDFVNSGLQIGLKSSLSSPNSTNLSERKYSRTLTSKPLPSENWNARSRRSRQRRIRQ